MADILEDYLVSMDTETKELYGLMRDAEREWIGEIKGKKWFASGGGDRRQTLVVTRSVNLPSLEKMITTKNNFYQAIQSLAHDSGKPESIGSRTTQLPVWLTREGRQCVTEPLENCPTVNEIFVYKNQAWRGAFLTIKEARELIKRKITGCGKSMENSKSLYQHARVESYQERIEILKTGLSELNECEKKYRNITARISSGISYKYRIKDNYGDFRLTFPTIGVVLGNKDTRVTDPRPRKGGSGKTMLFSVENVCFFGE